MDKIFFGMAAQEVAEGIIDAALFVKALAMAGGDDKRGRAVYITLRAEELEKLHRKERAIGAARAVAMVGGNVASGAVNAITSDTAKSGALGLFRIIKKLVLFVVLVLGSIFGVVVARMLIQAAQSNSNSTESKRADPVYQDGSRTPPNVKANPYTGDDEVIRMLNEASKNVNSNLPYALDEITRLDSSFVGPGRKFTYSHTILDDRAGPASANNLRAAVYPGARDYVCSNFLDLLRDGVVIAYSYQNATGALLTEIEMSGKDCGISSNLRPNNSGASDVGPSKARLAKNSSQSRRQNIAASAQSYDSGASAEESHEEKQPVSSGDGVARYNEEQDRVKAERCVGNERRVLNWRTGDYHCARPGDKDYR